MIRLVVNAEEFGAGRDSDAQVIEAHRDGIVTSTSLLGNCPDPQAARAALAGAPALGVGLSLALVGGRPVTVPQHVPSLVTPLGALRATPAEFVVDWLKGEISA